VIETALAIARDHPAYEGHFPGHPILPAVVLLAEVLAVLESETGDSPRLQGAGSGTVPGFSVTAAKFVRTVAPGTPLTLAREATAEGGIRFEVIGPAGVVASGRLAPAGPR